MAMEVLHNTCNMYIRDLPDIYALIPYPSDFVQREILVIGECGR